MTIINLPNGAGETTGDSLVTNSPLEYSGIIWYVSSLLGTDAVSPKGQNRNAPLATLGQANTNAASGDMIVLMAGHAETLTSTITVSKNLIIVGAGTTGSKPSVKLTNNQASGALLHFTGAYYELRNVWFPTNTVANDIAMVRSVVTESGLVKGCYFEFDANDDAPGISFGGGGSHSFRGTTFIVTGTNRADQPFCAVQNAEAVTTPLADFEGTIFDGGVAGFSNFFALDLSINAVTRITAEGVSALNGADLKIPEATNGYLNVGTSTGAARVDWCDV